MQVEVCCLVFSCQQM